MTEQLYDKLTVNRIGNVHYMNYAIKVHIPCIFFVLTTQMNPPLLLSVSQCNPYCVSVSFISGAVLSS